MSGRGIVGTVYHSVRGVNKRAFVTQLETVIELVMTPVLSMFTTSDTVAPQTIKPSRPASCRPLLVVPFLLSAIFYLSIPALDSPT